MRSSAFVLFASLSLGAFSTADAQSVCPDGTYMDDVSSRCRTNDQGTSAGGPDPGAIGSSCTSDMADRTTVWHGFCTRPVGSDGCAAWQLRCIAAN